MQSGIFKRMLEERDVDDVGIRHAFDVVKDAENYIESCGEKLDSVSKKVLRDYLDYLIEEKRNSKETLLSLARYYYCIDNKERYIDFTALFGSSGVMEQIMMRSDSLEAFAGYTLPSFGMDTEKLPDYTKAFMTCLEDRYEEETYFKILAGNNHGIPKEAVLGEKEILNSLGSLDLYLKERHQRKIEELQTYMVENKVWFEQIISEEVIAFIKANQEILSAVRKDNYLYVTKIPFDTKAFLEADEDQLKKYYVCHCPFVREGIKSGREDINPSWCYCSAGFAKFPFEVMFDRELKVELLETPLKGDLKCRFKIEIPDEIMRTYVKE